MQYVYDWNTSQAQFYITKGYIYDIQTSQVRYYVNGDYWYDAAGSNGAQFWANGKYIYTSPPGCSPAFYVA